VITDQARQVLSHLNQTTGSRYQVCSTSLETFAPVFGIRRVDDLCLVVDYKHADWRDSEQAQYLRPATLFIPKTSLVTCKARPNGPVLDGLNALTANGRLTRSRANFQSVDYSLPENSGFRS
jgi:uncharacterized phage protein (TIGR02220 family)